MTIRAVMTQPSHVDCGKAADYGRSHTMPKKRQICTLRLSTTSTRFQCRCSIHQTSLVGTLTSRLWSNTNGTEGSDLSYEPDPGDQGFQSASSSFDATRGKKRPHDGMPKNKVYNDDETLDWQVARQRSWKELPPDHQRVFKATMRACVSLFLVGTPECMAFNQAVANLHWVDATFRRRWKQCWDADMQLHPESSATHIPNGMVRWYVS